MTRAGSTKLALLDRLQPILLIGSIGLGLALASVSAGLGNALAPLVSIGVFALICFVMLGIDLHTVAGAFSNRRFVVIAVGINFVVNPLLAWGLGSLFLRSEPDLFAGFILFLVTPCIGWYLIFTELADGDTALGVSLLAVNIVLQILLLPVYLWLLAGRTVSIDTATISVSVVTYLVIPLGLAMSLRAIARRAGIDVDRALERAHVGYVKTAILMVIVVSMFASQADAIFANKGAVVRLVAPMIAFFALAFALSLAVGRAIAMPHPHVVALAFTTTSRNSEASLAIAATAFASPLVTVPVAIGPAIELPLLILMVRILNRRSLNTPHAPHLDSNRSTTTPHDASRASPTDVPESRRAHPYRHTPDRPQGTPSGTSALG